MGLLTVSNGYIMYLYSQWSSAMKPFKRKGAAMRGKNLPRPKESLESPAVTYKKYGKKYLLCIITLGDIRNISTISIFSFAVAPYNFCNFDTKIV